MNSQLRRSARAMFAVALLALACTEPDPPATKLAFLVQPVTAARDESITPAIMVEAQDAAGRRVTSWNGNITLSFDTLASMLSGTRTVAAVQGVATFSNLRVSTVATGLTLRASAIGLTNALSSPFDIGPGPGAKLAFSFIPGSVRAGAPITPPIVVEVQDDGGFRATSANDLVTLSLGANPAGAILSGALTATAVNGVATFATVTIDRSGRDYTLNATAAGLDASVSGAFHARGPFSAVTAGYFHSCGLASDAAYCWGDVDPLPWPVAGNLTFSSISSGRDERCALTSAGVGYCWSGSQTPIGVPGGITFSSIAAGYGLNCGLTSAGAGYCWGGNVDGELGNGTFGNSSASPRLVSGGLTFAQISAGRLFTCGATTNRAAYCWGNNGSGNLGTGTKEKSAVPVAVSGGSTFASVSAGGFHACALTSAGAAYCWGANGEGQVGDGTTVERTAPVAVSGGLTFATLNAGNRHTCGVTAAGAAYCWGDNTDGMLGRGSGPDSNVPVAVSGGLTFTSVRAGRFHTCGVTSDGEAYCWGSNASGLLGNGTGTASSTPVRVP